MGDKNNIRLRHSLEIKGNRAEVLYKGEKAKKHGIYDEGFFHVFDED